MLNRARSTTAAKLAALLFGLSKIDPTKIGRDIDFRAPSGGHRIRRPALAAGPSYMLYGMTIRSGHTVAQAKRAATKHRNRARNKAAHRG